MKAQLRPRWVAGIAVASLSALIAMTLGVAIVHGKASVAPLPIPGGDLILCLPKTPSLQEVSLGQLM